MQPRVVLSMLADFDFRIAVIDERMLCIREDRRCRSGNGQQQNQAELERHSRGRSYIRAGQSFKFLFVTTWMGGGARTTERQATYECHRFEKRLRGIVLEH